MRPAWAVIRALTLLELIRASQSRSQRPRSFCTATGITYIRCTKVTEALGTRLEQESRVAVIGSYFFIWTRGLF